MLARIAAAGDRDGGHGIRRQLKAGNGYDERGAPGRRERPTLVLHGRRDRVAPIADTRELARLIPAAELRVMPGGHLAILRAAAAAYAQRIDEFTAKG